VTYKVPLFTKIRQEQRREDSKKILQIPYLKHNNQTNKHEPLHQKKMTHLQCVKTQSKKDSRPMPCYLLTIPFKPKARPQNQSQALSLAKIQ